MLGAEPNTDGSTAAWLDEQGLRRDRPGRGGPALASPYATSRPGVFAVGDVRAGSVKRVASGVGEGSVVVQAAHRFLQPTG